MSIESTVPSAVRHPNDGWVMADLYPLRPFTRRALNGLARAMCPPPPAPQLPDLEERVTLQVQRMLRYMNPLVAFGFCLAVIALDWSPIWRLVSWRRAQSLEAERAASILEEVGWSRLPAPRLLVLGVRGLILSVYFDQDEVHSAMQYAPAPFIEQRIQLRRRLLHGGAPAASDMLGERR